MGAASSKAAVAPRELAADDPAAKAYAWRGGKLPALHEAARRGDAPAVAKMLRGGAPAGMASDKGDTALHWAAIGGHVAVMEALLAAGANADAKDIAGHNPVASATGVGACATSLALVPPLVAAGGDPNCVNRFGEPILMAPISIGDAAAFTALLRAGAAASLHVPLPGSPARTPAQSLNGSPALMRSLTAWQRSAARGARRCAACGAAASRQCEQCRVTYYCTRDCQVADWKGAAGHKRTCGSVGAVDVNESVVNEEGWILGVT